MASDLFNNITNTENSGKNKNFFNELEEIDQPEKINYNSLFNNNSSEDFIIINNVNKELLENNTDLYKIEANSDGFSEQGNIADINYKKSAGDQIDLIDEEISDVEHDKILKNLEQKNLLNNYDKSKKKSNVSSELINKIDNKDSENKKNIEKNIHVNVKPKDKSSEKKEKSSEHDNKKKNKNKA